MRSRRPIRGHVFTIVEIGLLAAISATAYAWTYQAQRRLFLAGITEDAFAFPRLGVDPALISEAMNAYWLGAAVVTASWVVVLLRSRSHTWRAVGWWPLGLAGLGYLVVVLARPSLSIDILSYVSHGYLASTGVTNPYREASGDVVNFPPGATLVAEGWTPVHGQTPYGPLWTQIERLAWLVSGGDVALGLLLLKGVAVAATLASALLIWLIVRRLRPGSELTAAAGFLWCPVVVVQFGLDGHNDALAITLTLVAVWAAGSGRAWLCVLALGLGGIVKFTPLIFAPPLIIGLILRAPSRLRALAEVTAGAVATLLLGWLLWREWWFGWSTLDGLRASTTPYPGPSLAGQIAQWLIDPSATEPDSRPQLILALVLLVAVLGLSWRRTWAGTVTSCMVIALVALALLPVYWPWYAGMAIALLALVPSWVSSAQQVALAVGAMVSAPLGDLAALSALSFEEMFQLGLWWGVALPVTACAVLGLAGVLVRRVALAQQRDPGEAETPVLH